MCYHNVVEEPCPRVFVCPSTFVDVFHGRLVHKHQTPVCVWKPLASCPLTYVSIFALEHLWPLSPGCYASAQANMVAQGLLLRLTGQGYRQAKDHSQHTLCQMEEHRKLGHGWKYCANCGLCREGIVCVTVRSGWFDNEPQTQTNDTRLNMYIRVRGAPFLPSFLIFDLLVI